jgi:hypothetical protein
MGILHKYFDEDRFYIKHSFVNQGRLIHMTYQVTDKAREVLIKKKIDEGDRIPKRLLIELEKDGLIFTNQSGVNEKEVSRDFVLSRERGLIDLSREAQMWVFARLENHPEVNLTLHRNDNENDEVIECIFDSIPNHFMEQLQIVAHRLDGTNFFSNLDKSYFYKIPKK